MGNTHIGFYKVPRGGDRRKRGGDNNYNYNISESETEDIRPLPVPSSQGPIVIGTGCNMGRCREIINRIESNSCGYSCLDSSPKFGDIPSSDEIINANLRGFRGLESGSLFSPGISSNHCAGYFRNDQNGFRPYGNGLTCSKLSLDNGSFPMSLGCPTFGDLPSSDEIINTNLRNFRNINQEITPLPNKFNGPPETRVELGNPTKPKILTTEKVVGVHPMISEVPQREPKVVENTKPTGKVQTNYSKLDGAENLRSESVPNEKPQSSVSPTAGGNTNKVNETVTAPPTLPKRVAQVEGAVKPSTRIPTIISPQPKNAENPESKKPRAIVSPQVAAPFSHDKRDDDTDLQKEFHVFHSTLGPPELDKNDMNFSSFENEKLKSSNEFSQSTDEKPGSSKAIYKRLSGVVLESSTNVDSDDSGVVNAIGSENLNFLPPTYTTVAIPARNPGGIFLLKSEFDTFLNRYSQTLKAVRDVNGQPDPNPKQRSKPRPYIDVFPSTDSPPRYRSNVISDPTQRPKPRPYIDVFPGSDSPPRYSTCRMLAPPPTPIPPLPKCPLAPQSSDPGTSKKCYRRSKSK